MKFAGFGVKHQERVFKYLSEVGHHKMLFLLVERRNRDSSALQEIRSEHRKRGNIPSSLRPLMGFLQFLYKDERCCNEMFLGKKSSSRILPLQEIPPKIKSGYVGFVALWELHLFAFLLIRGVNFQHIL